MRRGIVLADRYELDQPVGRGGMGEVWRASDRLLDRRVAVKLIGFGDEPPDDELVSRFEHEARSTAWLEHPGVPTVYDFGTCHDRLFLVMQYIDGITVGHLVDEHGPLPISWAALIAAQVCAVLSVAHQRPLVHRDLKPSNLMVCRDGSVKVLDFGIAVGLAPDDVRRTAVGLTPPGSPGYAAPEQLHGSPGPRSDLYSLGCVLYEMLTGRRVFTGETGYSVLRSHEEDQPVPVAELRPETPPALDALVLELLAKRPEDRPPDAAGAFDRLMEFVTELEPLADAVAADARRFRLYGAALGRIGLTGTPAPGPPAGPPTRGRLRRSRDEAVRLTADGRFARAAELLSPLAEPAAAAFGDDDPDVLELRLALADALFEGGDHRRAAPALRAAAAGLAEWSGPADERVLRYREREADCHAHLGNTDRALALLGTLAAEHPHTPDLREKLIRLNLSAGRTKDAHRLLADLPADRSGVWELPALPDD